MTTTEKRNKTRDEQQNGAKIIYCTQKRKHSQTDARKGERLGGQEQAASSQCNLISTASRPVNNASPKRCHGPMNQNVSPMGNARLRFAAHRRGLLFDIRSSINDMQSPKTVETVLIAYVRKTVWKDPRIAPSPCSPQTSFHSSSFIFVLLFILLFSFYFVLSSAVSYFTYFLASFHCAPALLAALYGVVVASYFVHVATTSSRHA